MAPGCESSRHLFQVLVDDRDEVMVALNSVGIFPGVHYRDNTLYRMYADAVALPATPSGRATGSISLPMHLRLGPEEIRRVAAALRDAVAERSAQR